MIHTLLFSFDRPAQLSGLLESIGKFDTGKVLHVHVLYGYSSDKYRTGYEKLKEIYPDITWLEEKKTERPPLNGNFNRFNLRYWFWWFKYPVLRRNRTNFKKLLTDSIRTTRNKYLMFLTDDSRFVQEIRITENALNSLAQEPVRFSFSLRHGKNQVNGRFQELENSIRWNPYENDPSNDWGQPFSVDGHIYSRSILFPIIRKVLFNNPNTFELFTMLYIKKRKIFNTITAFPENCLVGFELNRVQQFAPNNHLAISTEILNNYFLDGYTLDILYDPSETIRFRPDIKEISVKKGDEKIVLYNKNENFHGKE